MSILFTDPDQDRRTILSLATDVAELWNSSGGPERYGFKVFTSEEAAQIVSDEGGQVLREFFWEEPGAFKRIGTLLVLAQLTPLFALATTSSTKDMPGRVAPGVEREWLPRICYLLVPATLPTLCVVDPNTKKEHPLTEWKGFPSVHSKAEFMLWLEWLRDYRPDKLHSYENLVRRGRMALGTALILEAVYYQGANSSPIIGLCDKAMGDLTCGLYEAYLYETLRTTP